MSQFSYNTTFVYSLLVLDLLINITDNVVAPNKQDGKIAQTTLIILVIQILANLAVVIHLVVHLFNVSDQVRQHIWIATMTKGKHPNKNNPNYNVQIPQRVALKLVLGKYWWSLQIGIMYLVLTIILQIVRLDPVWHFYEQQSSSIRTNRPLEVSPVFYNSLQSYNEAYERDPTSTTTSLPDDLSVSSTSSFESKLDELLASTTVSSTKRPLFEFGNNMPPLKGSESVIKMGRSLIPLLVLLTHKLVSTCYYISFVVIYRLQPSQMIHRILYNHQQQHNGNNSNR